MRDLDTGSDLSSTSVTAQYPIEQRYKSNLLLWGVAGQVGPRDMQDTGKLPKSDRIILTEWME